MSESGRDRPTAARFPTTHWSRVAAATDGLAPAALQDLCRDYWFPLYAFVRSRGSSPHDAEDTVQGFLAELLERGDLAGLDPSKGRSGQPASPQTQRSPGTCRPRPATSPPVPPPWLPPAKGSISRHSTNWAGLAGESKRSTGSTPTSRTGQRKPRLACLSPWRSCGGHSRTGELTEI